MRSALRSIVTLAAACWLAGGPGGLTVREVLACRHDAMHHMAGEHASSRSNGPCFCDQMAGGSYLAVAEAVPAPPALPGVRAVLVAVPVYVAHFPLPASPAFPPFPPPPIRLG